MASVNRVTQSNIPLLECQNLSVGYRAQQKIVAVLRKFDLTISKGKTHGLVGESGCGKSTLAFAIARYLGRNGKILGGKIKFKGEDLTQVSNQRMQQIRSAGIAMVFQEPMSALNPSMRIKHQLAEVLTIQQQFSKAEIHDQVCGILEQVSIPDVKRTLGAYPHQLSGGQQQRVVIAMALLSKPDLLILDEPTTALDVTIEAGIVELIKQISSDTGMSMLFISHNLGLIREVSHSATVMYAGRSVEQGNIDDLFNRTSHPYTHGLLTSIPIPTGDGLLRPVNAIPGTLPQFAELSRGCDFAPRCQFQDKPQCVGKFIPMQEIKPNSRHLVRCARFRQITLQTPQADAQSAAPTTGTPAEQQQNIIKVDKVNKHYRLQNLFFRSTKKIYANNQISFQAKKGETLAIVGESGCGKTTLAKLIVGLETVSTGEIEFANDQNKMDLIGRLRLSRRSKRQKANIQMIFQNPFETLNPSQKVNTQLKHVIKLFNPALSGRKLQEQVNQVLRSVKIHPSQANRLPRHLSGGQKQRISIARAYAIDPNLIIADEPVSSLDVSVQTAVLELLRLKKQQLQNTLLLISHDLAVVRYLADFIIVMCKGEIVEYGSADQIFSPPYHPYTEALISAIQLADPQVQKRKVILAGDPSLATTVPRGCPIVNRCAYAIPGVCDRVTPPIRKFGSNHQIKCHLEKTRLQQMQPVLTVKPAITAPTTGEQISKTD